MTPPPLQLQLIPRQVPDAYLPDESGLSGNVAADISELRNRLVLYPGEPTEMALRLDNLGNRLLELDVQVNGNFPTEWCQVRMEQQTLTPGERSEAILLFQIPADFFESTKLNPRETLCLDFNGRLNIAATYPGSTPQLVESVAFQVYVRPRSLYLDFLPQIFREGDFTSRFLKIFEETFEPSVHTLNQLWAYLDPLTAPEALLPFLAHWVGWHMIPQIPLERQRHLIRNAVQLYHWRGTRRGLRLALHLTTGLPLDDHIPNEAQKHIAIFETFSRGFVLNNTEIGRDAILGGGRPYHFIVYLCPECHQSVDEAIAHTVIQQEKPVFCTYELHLKPYDS